MQSENLFLMLKELVNPDRKTCFEKFDFRLVGIMKI